MYKGKYNKRRKARKSPLLVLASLVLVLAMGIAGVSAFITTQSGKVENTFTLDPVEPTIAETFDGNTKTNVQVGVVENGRTEAAYIRATVVFTWVNPDNPDEVCSTPVKDGDYTITWKTTEQDTASKWVEGNDGYYYYKGEVAPGGVTDVLFTDCKIADGVTPPAGYTLSVEILAQTIQADGVDANGKTPVELAWGEHAASLVK